ncbi:NeuD/PglB/VioB family sugar acetyltransferase [Limnochorda pilosa]|uniref:NeuD/PglB/VioB family sugar acetyltransferase n=1 Tax=Limnochorda pilosa TaxID=1555112 RepID=UPI00130DAF6A|nr:NeuD/PglB/VioB family sugar acetyltransferase [Limnochorda pilosa]
MLLLGAGGHGRAVADAASAAGWHIAGFLDDHATEAPWTGASILGAIDTLPTILQAHPEWSVIVTLGDNRERRSVVERFAGIPIRFATVLAPSAYVSPTASVEPGSIVMHHAVVHAGSRIGPHAILNTGATIDHDCEIGEYGHISPGVHLAGTVKVEREAHVGIGASVIPGVRIGARAVVGAGAAVISDVPAGVTVVGVPARPTR